MTLRLLPVFIVFSSGFVLCTNGQKTRPFRQALQNFGAGISTALQNPGQALAAYFPGGLGGLFPFNIANLPSLPPLNIPEQVPQMMMSGLRNVSLIFRESMSNPVGKTVALFAAPLIPLMAMGGPANLAGMHHSMQMGMMDERSAHERRKRDIYSHHNRKHKAVVWKARAFETT